MTSPEAGKRAPAINLKDQNDTTVKLSSFKGRKVLVYFYPTRRHAGMHHAGLRPARHRHRDRRHGDPRDQPRPAGQAEEVRRQVLTRLHAAVRRRSRRRRGVRRVGREEQLRQEVHGRAALGVPDRRGGQGRQRLAEDQPEGHADEPARGARRVHRARHVRRERAASWRTQFVHAFGLSGRVRRARPSTRSATSGCGSTR